MVNVDIVKILIDSGADINIRNVHDKTPIYWASYFRDDKCVKLLVDSGAKLDAEYDDLTPIFAAAQNNHEECIKFFKNLD